MRILFLPHNGKPYGSNKSLFSVMRHMKKSSEVMIITPIKNYDGDNFNAAGIKNYNLPYYPAILYVRINYKYIIYPFLVLIDIIMFPFLVYRAAKFNPDIIYSNTSQENMGLFLAKILGKKHIAHVREFGDYDYDFYFILGKKMRQNFLNLSDGLIFNSNAVQQHVLPVNRQKAKSAVIYNGVKVQNLDYHYLVFPVGRPFVFGIVGYIQKAKGQFEALRFMEKHLKSKKNLKVNIYGGGVPSYMKAISTFVNSHGLNGKVNLCGFKNNVSEIYDSIDVLLVFAKNEAFGRVTIEAMQKGVPVIGFRGGGTTELLNHKITGLLFGNEDEFDECIVGLLQGSELYETISKNAIVKAREYFNEDDYCNKVEDFIRGI